MFKAKWEKTRIKHIFPLKHVEDMARLFHPHARIIAYELLDGGCSNLNFKIQLECENHPLILRIYTRDKSKNIASIEQKLAKILHKNIPVPMTHYVGKFCHYSFAITDFMAGITLRDLLLSNLSYNLCAIIHDVGALLAKITSYAFHESGFFDEKLNIITHHPSDILNFVHDCLNHTTVISVLPHNIHRDISKVFENSGDILLTLREKHLVHGDFDPANILVDHINGEWKVSGILDFEFAFSGSVLWDVANMLRYSHKMPPEFKSAFIESLTKNGVQLHNSWPSIIHLLNLSALLDCLKRSDPRHHPHRCADIVDLMTYILSVLNPSLSCVRENSNIIL